MSLKYLFIFFYANEIFIFLRRKYRLITLSNFLMARDSERDSNKHEKDEKRRDRDRKERDRDSREYRDREKNRDREHRDRDKEGREYREKESSSRSRRKRSHSKDRERDPKKDKKRKEDKSEHKKEKSSKSLVENLSQNDEEMMRLMGFGGFDTTKNKHVDGNVEGEAKINRARKYRQYMNRRGGFNRPLDYVA